MYINLKVSTNTIITSQSFLCSFSTVTVDNYSSKVTMLTLLLLQTVTAGGVRLTCGITEIFVLDGYSKYVIIPVVRTLRRRANMSSRTRAQNTLKEWTHNIPRLFSYLGTQRG